MLAAVIACNLLYIDVKMAHGILLSRFVIYLDSRRRKFEIIMEYCNIFAQMREMNVMKNKTTTESETYLTSQQCNVNAK